MIPSIKDCESNRLLETATNYLFEIVELFLKLIEHGVFLYLNMAALMFTVIEESPLTQV